MNIMFKYWYTLYTKQTEAEICLDRELPRLGVRYRTQHPVLSARAIIDFYFPDYYLAVEVDDPGHLRSAQIKKDQERNNRLEALGVKTLRYSNKLVLTETSWVVSDIQRELDLLTKTDGMNKSIGIWKKETNKNKKPYKKSPEKIEITHRNLIRRKLRSTV